MFIGESSFYVENRQKSDISAAGTDEVAAPTAPTASTTQGSPATTESAAVTFTDLTAGQSITVGGLTLTASGDITAADVATGFASLSENATEGSSVTNGAWSGTLTGWSTGTASGNAVTFTSSTANTDVEDLTISAAGTDEVAAPNAPTASTTQGSASEPSDSTPTAFDVVTFFDTTSDKLSLPSASLLSTLTQDTVDGLTMAVSSGIVTFTGEGDASAKIDALLTGMGTSEAVAGFVDNGNAYIVCGDGLSGSSESDIVVELAGVDSLTALATIIENDA